jgi:hypothetical protein
MINNFNEIEIDESLLTISLTQITNREDFKNKSEP